MDQITQIIQFLIGKFGIGGVFVFIAGYLEWRNRQEHRERNEVLKENGAAIAKSIDGAVEALRQTTEAQHSTEKALVRLTTMIELGKSSR